MRATESIKGVAEADEREEKPKVVKLIARTIFAKAVTS